MLLLLLGICALPVLLAYALYFLKPGWLSPAATNHGELMKPVQPLPALNLYDASGTAAPADTFKVHWSLVYLGGEHCDTACAERIREVRNIRPLLRDNRKRLEVYYVAPDRQALQQIEAALQGQQPLPHLLRQGADADARAMDALKRAPGSVLMIDPLGNWVLSYPPDTTPKNIYLDLKHLLRYSQIG